MGFLKVGEIGVLINDVHVGIQRRRLKKRVGRGKGSGHGKTSTRGHKGQRSRAGTNMPRGSFEGGQMPLARRIPKLGFNNRFKKQFAVVNISDLEAQFEAGATVDEEALKRVGLAKGMYDGVKVLGQGELTKKLVVRATGFSKSAVEKITKAGGEAVVLEGRKKPEKRKMKPRGVAS